MAEHLPLTWDNDLKDVGVTFADATDIQKGLTDLQADVAILLGKVTALEHRINALWRDSGRA